MCCLLRALPQCVSLTLSSGIGDREEVEGRGGREGGHASSGGAAQSHRQPLLMSLVPPLVAHVGWTFP